MTLGECELKFKKKKKVRGYCVADECVVNDALTITRMFLKPLRKQISHADHLKLQ